MGRGFSQPARGLKLADNVDCRKEVAKGCKGVGTIGPAIARSDRAQLCRRGEPLQPEWVLARLRDQVHPNCPCDDHLEPVIPPAVVAVVVLQQDDLFSGGGEQHNQILQWQWLAVEGTAMVVVSRR